MVGEGLVRSLASPPSTSSSGPPQGQTQWLKSWGWAAGAGGGVLGVWVGWTRTAREVGRLGREGRGKPRTEPQDAALGRRTCKAEPFQGTESEKDGECETQARTQRIGDTEAELESERQR